LKILIYKKITAKNLLFGHAEPKAKEVGFYFSMQSINFSSFNISFIYR
jgi:hypothetical protein